MSPSASPRILRLPPGLTGRTEAELAPAIREALEDPAGAVVLDCAAVKTCDSAGIGVLVGLVQRARAQDTALVLAAVGGQPRLVLERVRVLGFIPTYDTVEEAVASVRGKD